MTVSMSSLPGATNPLPRASLSTGRRPHFHPSAVKLFARPRQSFFIRTKVFAASDVQPTKEASVQPIIPTADRPLLTATGFIKMTPNTKGKESSEELTTVHISACVGKPVVDMVHKSINRAIIFVVIQMVLAAVFLGKCFWCCAFNKEEAPKKNETEKKA